MAEKHVFQVTLPKGMESGLVEELSELLGLPATTFKPTVGAVGFEGTLAQAYRICMHSRLAGRVLLTLKEFPAPDADRLYAGVRQIHWTEHLGDDATLAVDFNGTSPTIKHSRFGAQKVKDAICDQFLAVKGSRPSVDLVNPAVRLNVHLKKDRAALAIDLSGESLHRRGYRREGAFAPLKENLASALLRAAGWAKLSREDPDAVFLDPMCGSGTLVIEAAQMAFGIAPGLGRRYFGFMGWLGHVPATWTKIVDEAREQRREAKVRGAQRGLPTLFGWDVHPSALQAARENAHAAGLEPVIRWERKAWEDSLPPAPKGLLLVNPPYGERIGEVEELMPLYKSLGDRFKRHYQGWRAGVFTGSPELSKVIGLKPSRRHVFFNGPIECRLFEYELYSGSRRPPGAGSSAGPGAGPGGGTGPIDQNDATS